MSDLQDVIATSTIRAYNQGVRDEHERFVKSMEQILEQLKAELPPKESK